MPNDSFLVPHEKVPGSNPGQSKPLVLFRVILIDYCKHHILNTIYYILYNIYHILYTIYHIYCILYTAANRRRSGAQNNSFLVPHEEVPGLNPRRGKKLVFFKVSSN